MSIIWIAFEVIINFYEGFMETYFIYKFLPPKTESTKKNIIAFALCFCTLGLLITVMNYLTIFEGILGIVCYLMALFLYALVNRKGSIIKKLFAATVPLVILYNKTWHIQNNRSIIKTKECVINGNRKTIWWRV